MEPAAAARRRLRACVGGRLDRRPAVGGLVFTLRLSGRASSPCRWPPRHASQRTGGRGDGSTTAPSRSRRFRRDRLSAPAPLAAGATWLSLAGHLGGRAAWPPSRATATGGTPYPVGPGGACRPRAAPSPSHLLFAGRVVWCAPAVPSSSAHWSPQRPRRSCGRPPLAVLRLPVQPRAVTPPMSTCLACRIIDGRCNTAWTRSCQCQRLLEMNCCCCCYCLAAWKMIELVWRNSQNHPSTIAQDSISSLNF